MGEDLLTTLSMENHSPSTLLSMDPSGVAPSCMPLPMVLSNSSHEECERELLVQQRSHQTALLGPPPDINLPFSNPDPGDLLEVGLGSHPLYEPDVMISLPKPGNRKAAKRGDSIWGAWFFFSFYFKPLLSDKSKSKLVRDVNGVAGFEKSDLRLDSFLVQHDMENMYMWVFKERPENALGKMQLRSYMNGHSRPSEPQFPFSVDKGFVRSHRMQRKHYRGLSNPQCIHGIEVVQSPNLALISDGDKKRWIELTGRDLNFSIPPEASDFGSWRNLPNSEFELERSLPVPPSLKNGNSRKHLNGSGLNLSSPSDRSGDDGMDLSPVSSCKKRKDMFIHNGMEQEECFLPLNPCTDRVSATQTQDVEMHQAIQLEPHWISEFTGVMRQACGPVTAAKTIYEDEEGYLITVSLPFADQQRVKVSWRNSLTHGIVKILCISTARMPYVKRHDRIFKLTDPAPEHCPPGEFIREIPLATRIPEDAKLEAYFDEAGSVLEIIVPKHRSGPEEHEVHVCKRPPHLNSDSLLLT
ncbi:hypothetical protein LUZ63_000088 [Rhynchospora breviuscula]|uniref:HSP20-like chaperones superfamily protein n=1 Tax=Rhynchospora breviuscula TaxID=2022672 RepID=A0A9Q0CVJ4_9POAL|nr:hypothetical protein LUZ63_000088 [Rhynchospora breviuscula]